MVRALILFFTVVCFSSINYVGNDIAGVWINADQTAHIKIYSAYGKYYGFVAWMKDPLDSVTGKPQLDINNKDSKLKSRAILNLIVLNDLQFDSEKQEWSNGTIYDPKSATTYDVTGTLLDHNTLQMHFYMTLPIVGKTFIWKRITK